MTYKNYKIEENDCYNSVHPESRFIFFNTNDCDEAYGCGRSIEDCVNHIDEMLDILDN